MTEPVINLDAARAARREAKATAPSLVFGKQKFKLPVELPFSAIEHLGQMDPDNSARTTVAISGFIKGLLGDQYEAFNKLQPSAKDIELLMEELARVYGFQSSGE